MPRMRAANALHLAVGCRGRCLNLVRPRHLERVPRVADLIDLDVEIQASGRPRAEFRRRGDVGIYREEIVARVLPHRPVDTGSDSEGLIGCIREPGQQQVPIAEVTRGVISSSHD